MWPPSKCDASRTGYGLRPSSQRVGLSTPCMTASTGTTFSGRRGSVSEPIVGQRGSMQITIAAVEAYGAERMVAELQKSLRAGNYHPAPVRRVEIPKPDGSSSARWASRLSRTVCASRQPRLVLEPIFEADFSALLVWVPAQALGHRRHGEAPGRLHRRQPSRTAVAWRHCTSEPVPKGLGQLLPHRECSGTKFVQLDRYVVWRLRRLLVKKRGRNLRAGQANRWTRDLVPRPGPAPAPWALSATRKLRNHVKKTVGKPCAGKPHARIERRMGNRACTGTDPPLTTNGDTDRRTQGWGRDRRDEPPRAQERRQRQDVRPSCAPPSRRSRTTRTTG